MVIPVYLCLRCGHVFPAKKTDVPLRRCSRCGSVDLIRISELEEMAKEVKRYLESPLHSLIPLVDTIRVIFRRKGLLRYRALSTLNLEALLYKMAVENKSIDVALKEVFRSSLTFHK